MSANFRAGESIITVDRRRGDRRDGVEVTKPAKNSGNVDKRRKDRRRQIDPTTCERDYSNDEVEFMKAVDNYKRRTGRMFPSCGEVLEVVAELGYKSDRKTKNMEQDFIVAIDDYKRKNGRMFPTCSEILEVVRALGFDKPICSDHELVMCGSATTEEI